MLPIILQTAFVAGLLILLGVILYMVRKNALQLRYAVLWIFFDILLIIVAVWPQILALLSRLLGITTVSNALFALLFFGLLLIMLSLTSIVSRQSRQILELSQYVALLEKRIRDDKGQL